MQPRLRTTVLEIAPAAMEGRSKTEQGDKEETIPSILSDGKSLENQKQGRAKDGAGGPGVAVKAESARAHSHIRNASAEAPAYPVPCVMWPGTGPPDFPEYISHIWACCQAMFRLYSNFQNKSCSPVFNSLECHTD